MGHPTTTTSTIFLLPFLLLIFVTFAITNHVEASRAPSAIPFPKKEELEYLTSEEEERLIYGGDESVILSKIRDLPDGSVHAPDAKELPLPTMDPPLPEAKPRRPQKSNRGFPFRIPRIFLKQGARMITPLNRKPRTRMGTEHVPVPSYRARPSTLVSSEPDQLEVAFKRIEIMASRAGLNMSAMPRRTQMQVLKRLIPKLPPRLSYLVKNEMKDHATKMYEYLPEPMKDPLIEDTQSYLSSFIEDDSFVDGFSDFSVQTPSVKKPEFDASKISITHEDMVESHEQFGHLPSITEKYAHHDQHDDKGSPSFVLIPPSELHDELHDFESHKYEESSSHNLERDSLYSRETKQHSHHKPSNNNEHNPSYTQIKHTSSSSSSDYLDSSASDAAPSILTAGNRGEKSLSAVKISAIKNSTPSPVRVALPTKDRFVTISQKTTKFHNLTEPIRVSIISKDRISINRSSDPFVKVVHIEPVRSDDDGKSVEETAAVVEELKPKTTTTTEEPNPIAENEAHKQLTRLKFITKDVIKAEEDKYKLSQEKSRSRTTTTSTTTAPSTPDPATLSPDIILKLDNYDDNEWADSYDDELWADQYDLTDEEIAATVAELKKYEEQSSLDNSLEQEYPWRLTPHPLEYPDHPDHPKDSPEEPKSDKDKKTDSGASNVPIKRPFLEHIRRPGIGGSHHPRRPPMRRPPFKRPPHHRRPPRPPGPPGPRPLRINDVTISQIPKEFSKECDYFSENLCLVVQDYPIEAISEALEKHPDMASVLVKEPEVERSWVDGVPRTQEHNYNFKHYFGQQRRSDEEVASSHRHRDFAGEGGFLCPSKVAYGQVKKAKSSSTGEWKYVVNFGENTQTLRLEKCLSPGNTCSYVMPHYRTACTQVHNYHRLLAWDSEKGLHMDVFKIPTCCTCHVQGYYIPQQAQGLGFTHARRRDLPPKLNFAPPPRPPFGRGAKKIPSSLLTPVPNGPAANPSVVVTDLSTKPNDKTKEHAISSSAKELKDDLQDLLAQYSALRERIAKKKNENIAVSYVATVSNSTDSLRPKTRESRNPTKLKPLLQLKKLQLLSLKKMNMTTKNGKLKRPLARARAMLLARLNRKLKSARRGGRAMRQQWNRVGPSSGEHGSGNGGSILSMENLKSRIQLLRTRLNKYNERNKVKPHHSQQQQHQHPSPTRDDRLRESQSKINNKVSDSNYSSSNNNNSKVASQRLRLSSNRPSKVNYSYHPIMDYFNSKTRLAS